MAAAGLPLFPMASQPGDGRCRAGYSSAWRRPSQCQHTLDETLQMKDALRDPGGQARLTRGAVEQGDRLVGNAMPAGQSGGADPPVGHRICAAIHQPRTAPARRLARPDGADTTPAGRRVPVSHARRHTAARTATPVRRTRLTSRMNAGSCQAAAGVEGGWDERKRLGCSAKNRRGWTRCRTGKRRRR